MKRNEAREVPRFITSFLLMSGTVAVDRKLPSGSDDPVPIEAQKQAAMRQSKLISAGPIYRLLRNLGPLTGLVLDCYERRVV